MTIRAGIRRAISSRAGGGGPALSAAALYATATQVNSVARRVVPAYVGNLIRVRDVITTTQTDIGQAASALDETALLAAVAGVNEGRCVTIYSQSGGADLTQATAGTQMRIVATLGAIDKINGKPAIIVTTANQCYRGIFGGGAVNTPLMTLMFVCLASSVASSGARMVSGFTAALADGGGTGNFPTSNNVQVGADDQRRSVRSGNGVGGIIVPAAAINAYCLRYDGFQARLYAARYASGGAQVGAATSTLSFDRLAWGATSQASGQSHVNQSMCESVVWIGRVLTEAQIATIFADMTAFWTL